MHELVTSRDLDALLDDIGERRIVMLGEASHGTHEYYTWRSAISKRLIEEKGFSFIAVEGDWPDCYRINRYVKNYPDAPEEIKKILLNFNRWPTWMWANWEIAALAEWIRNYNGSLPVASRIGFYGLDVYSLWDSIYEMMKYLDVEDPFAAKAVKQAILCFEPFQHDEQQYARFTLAGHSCRDKVKALLREIRSRAQFMDGDREAGFNTEQNAFITVNAERYYRSMTRFDNESWNVRDIHMMETLNRLMKFHGKQGKAIVWEHNTHMGDARATDMKSAGMVNIGQLAREQYGIHEVYLAGFGCYIGQVIAGAEWGAPMEEMDVPPARDGSMEHLLHREIPQPLYSFQCRTGKKKVFSAFASQGHRCCISSGAGKSRQLCLSNMADRYDAFIYMDKTSAVHPLHMQADKGRIPETYPFGV